MTSPGAGAGPSIPLSVTGASGQPGALASILSGTDAEAELVKALVDHQLVLTAEGTRCAAFLAAYVPDVLEVILRLRRYHQPPAGLVKALDAISLKTFMQGLSVNLGNK